MGLWIEGLGVRVHGLGFRVKGLGFMVLGFDWVDGVWFMSMAPMIGKGFGLPINFPDSSSS